MKQPTLHNVAFSPTKSSRFKWQRTSNSGAHTEIQTFRSNSIGWTALAKSSDYESEKVNEWLCAKRRRGLPTMSREMLRFSRVWKSQISVTYWRKIDLKPFYMISTREEIWPRDKHGIFKCFARCDFSRCNFIQSGRRIEAFRKYETMLDGSG